MPEKLAGVDIGAASPNIYKVFNRYVDGVVFLPDRILLIEAKILAEPGAVSQLKNYAMLFYQTPEFASMAGTPLELQIVTCLADPSFLQFAKGEGVGVVIFKTPAAEQYLSILLGARPNNVR